MRSTVDIKNRKVAFTLAEVLITLGLIGVVAAITMPTLVANYQKQVLVNQLKSAYSIISNGIDRMMIDAKTADIRETNLFALRGDDLVNYLKKYFNVVFVNAEGDVKEYLSCTNNSGGEYSCVTIANGSVINGPRYVLANGQWLYVTNYYYYLEVEVDINGEKKPNVFGRDVFSFRVEDDGTISPQDSRGIGYIGSSAPGAKYIIEHGWKMDY